jgi:hypothetical protein
LCGREKQVADCKKAKDFRHVGAGKLTDRGRKIRETSTDEKRKDFDKGKTK